jgi:hypothetical protein
LPSYTPQSIYVSRYIQRATKSLGAGTSRANTIIVILNWTRGEQRCQRSSMDLEKEGCGEGG